MLSGHHNAIQVIDRTDVTIYSWTHPKKGLVWCLASVNGYNVSRLKWGGNETYAEVLFELLAKSPTFLAATGLRLGAASFASTMFVCYTIGFRLSNFHPMAADPPWVWNIQSVNLASGGRNGGWLPGIPRQAAYNCEDLVRLVGSQDVRRRGIRVEDGWKTLSSYRGAPLRMQMLPSPASPCPASWPAGSRSPTPHLITVLSSTLAGQKSVQTSCMRRPSSSVSASSCTVAARHNKSSRRGTSIIASGPFSVLPIRATFLISLSLCPVSQGMRGLSIMSSTSLLNRPK